MFYKLSSDISDRLRIHKRFHDGQVTWPRRWRQSTCETAGNVCTTKFFSTVLKNVSKSQQQRHFHDLIHKLQIHFDGLTLLSFRWITNFDYSLLKQKIISTVKFLGRRGQLGNRERIFIAWILSEAEPMKCLRWRSWCLQPFLFIRLWRDNRFFWISTQEFSMETHAHTQ